MIGLASLSTAARVIIKKFIMPLLSNNYQYGLLVAKIAPHIAKIGSFLGLDRISCV